MRHFSSHHSVDDVTHLPWGWINTMHNLCSTDFHDFFNVFFFFQVCLPYVPATSTQVAHVMKLLNGRSGTLVDLGSGDGRIVSFSMASFNSLWPIDAIWRQRSGSTLTQVMAFCLPAPSHYLNQCWLIICEVQRHHIRTISLEMPQPSITKICLKITYLKFHSNFSGANELTHCGPVMSIFNSEVLWHPADMRVISQWVSKLLLG